MNAAEDLVERVRRARKDRGWTQQQLAEAAGISLRTYQNFENRVGTPQSGNLRAILTAVGVEPIGEETADATRQTWPGDILVFLDMIGAYLATMSAEQRQQVMHQWTREIFETRTRGHV